MLLSVIIPIGPKEQAWRQLLPQLNCLPKDTEVIVVSPPQQEKLCLNHSPLAQTYLFEASHAHRGVQQNLGAKHAKGQFLWFLHADSHLTPDAIHQLIHTVSSNPEGLWYFDLEFAPDGPRWIKLNQWGARWRSRYLHAPFGDQGLCIARKHFVGFPEKGVGEDHRFVNQCRLKGIPIRPVKATITTSARKYSQQGWFVTTARHLYLTAVEEIRYHARVQSLPHDP